ncbi:MAG: hypothetical protein HFJ51_04355 [Clostridia bacterium]|nr:hypothetical protein [Clostridia bacterium]
MPFLGYIIGILVLFIILKILALPMKIIVKFLINAVVGVVVLYVLNLLGVGLVINWITALIVGFLGIPGVIIVAILQFVLHLI